MHITNKLQKRVSVQRGETMSVLRGPRIRFWTAVKLAVTLGCTLIFLNALKMQGQAFVNGAITGRVMDQSGAVLPGAQIVLTNLDSSVIYTTTVSADGLYRFPDIPPGVYSLEATKAGFKRFIQRPVLIQVNSTVPIDIVLPVGAATEQVTVSAEEPLLQPETSSLGAVIEERETNDMPLNGRNPVALLSLDPAVITQNGFGGNPIVGNSFASGNFQISGGAANQNAAFWDGAIMNASGYINELAIQPTQDSLQEFKVMTNNLSAEYDRFAGGIVSFVTKSGTNSLHGEAYEFLRNKVLNANDYFSNHYGVPTPQFTQNQFGFNLGGPVFIPRLYNGIERKTFFFFSYDGFRNRTGSSVTLTVPTTAMRQGIFSTPIYDPATTTLVNGSYVRQLFPGNQIPSTRFDPAAKYLLNLWGQPTVQGSAANGPNNWFGHASGGGNVDEYIARGDHTFSDRQHAFVRYTLQNERGLGLDPFGTHAYAAGGPPSIIKNQQAVVDDSFQFSPRALADLEFTYLRTALAVTSGSLGFNESNLGPGWAAIASEIPTPTLPDLGFSDGSASGFGGDGTIIGTYTDDFGILPNITLIKGRHSLKFGADLRLSRLDYGQNNVAGGTFGFSPAFTSSSPINGTDGSAFASFLLGDSTGGSIETANFIAAQLKYRALYAIDNVKVTNKLTINAGLRWSKDGAFSERHNRLSIFDTTAVSPLASVTGLPLVGKLALVDSPDRPSRTNFDTTNLAFSPRLGFGYAVDAKTAVRGGYGIFWLPDAVSYVPSNPADDPINQTSTQMVGSINGGITPSSTLSNPFPTGVIQPPGRTVDLNPQLYGLTMFAGYANTKSAYVQQWNFDVQRELPGGVIADVAYAGAKGTHLPIVIYWVSTLPDQYMSMGQALLAPVPNPFVGTPAQQGVLAATTVPRLQLLKPYEQYNIAAYGNNNIGGSMYNSLQVKLQKHFSRGQTFLVAYMHGRNRNNGAESTTEWLNGVAPPQDYNNPKGEWSASTFDVTNRMVTSYVLELPFGQGKRFGDTAHGVTEAVIGGWAIDGVYTYQGGFPLYFATAINQVFVAGPTSRPNYNFTGSCSNHNEKLGGSGRSRLSGWFNTSCFAQPPAFTYGNVSRTSPELRSAALDNIDLAVAKSFPIIGEKLKMDFRAEAFNFMNHPQFGYPGMTQGASNFGVVGNQANNPRLIQFGAKLHF
jgi:hypothetical protein